MSDKLLGVDPLPTLDKLKLIGHVSPRTGHCFAFATAFDKLYS
jgi:hypothetical protein